MLRWITNLTLFLMLAACADVEAKVPLSRGTPDAVVSSPGSEAATTEDIVADPEASSAGESCDLKPAFTRPDEGGSRTVQVFEGEPIPELGGARPIAFATTLKVNTDGTRISYHRDDPRGRTRAINDIRNAMREPSIADFERLAVADWEPISQTWRFLSESVIEKSATTGKPCVTPEGFLVSMTADVAVDGGFKRQGDCDQTKWIDALTIPALVLPGGNTQFGARGVKTRSPVAAFTINAPRNRAFGIVGDFGPQNELGEASVAMNRALNGLPATEIPLNREDAKRRFQAPKSVVVIFPGDANRATRPLTPASVLDHARTSFQAWGGQARLAACLPLFD